MGLDAYLRPEFVVLKNSLKPKCEVLGKLLEPYVESAEFPPYLIDRLKDLKIDGALSINAT
jgi:hypothetical protein